MFPDDADVARGARRDVRSVRVPRAAEASDGLLKTDFKQPLGKVSLPRALPLARAEHRPEDARGARVDPGHRGEHGRALLRPRRHLGREERVLRQLDEDRPAGVPPDGRAAARLRQLRLPDRRAPHPAGHRRGRAQGARRRIRSRCCAWPTASRTGHRDGPQFFPPSAPGPVSACHCCVCHVGAGAAGALVFGVLGDTPYTEAEIGRARRGDRPDQRRAARLRGARRRHRLEHAAAACSDALAAGAQEAVRAHPPPLHPPARRQRVERLQGAAGAAEGLASPFLQFGDDPEALQAGGRILRARALGAGRLGVRRAQRAGPRQPCPARGACAAHARRLRLARRGREARVEREGPGRADAGRIRSGRARATASPRCASACRTSARALPGESS